jgi:hypothetical protein
MRITDTHRATKLRFKGRLDDEEVRLEVVLG